MRERIHSSLNAVKFAGEHGADKGEMAYEELMFLRQCVVTWCEHHPRLIWKRQTATWLDDSPLE
jgi:hypothetical protein